MADLDLYKELIDALVAASPDGYVGGGPRPPRRLDFPDSEDISALLISLTDEQLQLITRMLQAVRVGGILDAIRVLLDDGGYRLSKAGRAVPYQPFGTESHFDYIVRLDGHEWPELA